MNWQAEGVNGKYRTAKFEEISPKKTGDINVKVGHFFDHTTFGKNQNRNSPRSLFEHA